MSGIKPIETVYNGYRFRSRLEARWAYFFDLIGVKYEYEPEGFEVGGGYRYLPDFYLPRLETYVEVKPEDAFEIAIIDEGARFQTGYEKYAYATNAIARSMGKMFLIVFGDPYHAFPRPTNDKAVPKSHLFFTAECGVHFIMRTANKQAGRKVFFCTTSDGNEQDCSKCEHWRNIPTHSFPVFIDGDTLYILENAVIRDHTTPFELAMETSRKARSKWDSFLDAALKARQARFEHGERPII